MDTKAETSSWLSPRGLKAQRTAQRAEVRVRARATAPGASPLNVERGLLRATHPNILVVGAQAAVMDVLHRLGPDCRRPVASCEAGSFLALPRPSPPSALILRDVGNLTPEGQRRLMEWLDDDARDRIQVIATNATALWPKVKDGSFTEALFYRLNVIYIDLTDGAAPSTEKL